LTLCLHIKMNALHAEQRKTLELSSAAHVDSNIITQEKQGSGALVAMATMNQSNGFVTDAINNFVREVNYYEIAENQYEE